ncbi:hypothetical protein [Insolitispirillum peregrinum]|uniref:hypothetical protein n=1 Tax=Insolitispirillum peregrinum TaxID=80876 RepID=UPI003609C6F9
MTTPAEPVSPKPKISASAIASLQKKLDEAQARPPSLANAEVQKSIQSLVKADCAVLGWRLCPDGLWVVTADGRKTLHPTE